MRMVIKENFSRDMVELLFSDVMKAYKSLEQSEAERIEGAKGKEKQSLLYEGLFRPVCRLLEIDAENQPRFLRRNLREMGRLPASAPLFSITFRLGLPHGGTRKKDD